MTTVGLTSAEAAARLAASGPNRLVDAPHWQRAKKALALLADPMALMLVVAGVLDLLLGQRIDAIILFVALVPVLGVDVVLEARSERALARLRAAVAPTARVMRDGREQAVATESLVPGDVLVVREGDLVFADARVLDTGVTVDEAHLTGEAEPQARGPGESIHAGSRIVAGRANAEVTTTGRATAYGKVAALVAEASSGETPLQHRIGRMVKRLYLGALVVVVVQLSVELALGRPASVALIAAVTLAMSAAPEEFPLVFTVFLSLGAARLARKGLLVRRLVSVEALGSTTVICVDKTGTLTHGRFELDEHLALDGVDDQALLEAAALACEPTLDDAMEVAIADHCKIHGVDVAALYRARLAADHPFEAAGRHITHVWQRGPRWTVAIKGALEGVLEHCPAADAAAAHAAMAALAARGMRVLAVARRDGEGPAPTDRGEAETGVRLVGLLGFRDPVRTEAREAVASCASAGIHIKVVTGDHALTARAVAEAVGLPVDDVLTGAELEALPPGERADRIRRATVLARIRPEQKYEIVDRLTAAGEVVARAGDGITDAPALRRAAIGVSMGARATEVAREAAGMVLLRDDLGAIVESVREGRHIYLNLQRAFLFLVAFHIPLIGLSLFAVLQPIHLVLLELVIHPMSALVFEGEPAPPDLMRRPPRPPGQAMLPRPLLVRSIITGLVLTAAAIAIFVARRGAGEDVARSAAVVAVIAGGLAIAWVERGLEGPWWRAGVPRTLRFWIVSLAVVATVALALAVPPFARALHITVVTPSDLGLAAVAAVAAIAWRLR